jgi:hypothetical protein
MCGPRSGYRVWPPGGSPLTLDSGADALAMTL